ncbi:MAG: periplasmic heavy metal sensor [Pseudomonadota bacterium]
MSAEAPRRRTPLWLRITLAVSLALNLLIVGMVVGVFVRFGGGPPPRAAVDFAVPYVRALAPAQRRAVFRDVRARGEDAPMRRAARARSYATVVEALRAQPFDPAALKALVRAQAEGAAQLQRTAQAAWLGLVAQMSDAERAAYADRVAEFAQRPRKHKSGD